MSTIERRVFDERTPLSRTRRSRHETRWRADGPSPTEHPSTDADGLRYTLGPDVPVNTPRVSSVMPDRE